MTRGSEKAPQAEAASPEQAGDTNDPVLLGRLTQGDRAALALLYSRHAALLLALAYRILQDKHEAEDLIHDVFLQAWQHCAEYSEARGSVRSWLLLRTRSRALDRLRARGRRSDFANRSDDAHATNPAELTANTLTDRERLPAALAQMPVTQKDVIVLSYFEGLSAVEISSRLGIPAGTVKSRTHAAIATLRLALGVADD